MKQKRNSRPDTSGNWRQDGKHRSIQILLGICLVAIVIAGLGALLFFKNREPNLAQRHSPEFPSQNQLAIEEPELVEEDPARAVELLEEGNELLVRGDVKGSLVKYQQALRLYPHDEDIHYNLGIVYGKLGQTELAIKHNLQALEILPDYPEVHNNLGNLLVNQQKFDEAARHFRAALELQPDYPLAHNNLGNALARQGKMNEAILSFSEAARLKPDYIEAHFNLGNAYSVLGRTDEAIAQFQFILQLQPDFQPARQALARAAQKQQLGGR